MIDWFVQRNNIVKLIDWFYEFDKTVILNYVCKMARKRKYRKKVIIDNNEDSDQDKDIKY